ncbi:MAG: alpha-2-macroglobulin, partial [Deltaproteobacteria bacterium]|nr:alpha-2-macroglobulin [Deltaproteobacteria bacterium]
MDRPENGQIRVDEPSLAGTVASGQLLVDLPVTGVAGGKGELTVSVAVVDGTRRVESATVAYEIARGESKVLRTSLRVPADVAAQADWVRYVLRVDDGDAQGLRVTRSLLGLVQPYDLVLDGPARITQDRVARYRVRAEHPRTREPLPGVEVALDLERDGKSVQTLRGRTGDRGEAVLEVGLKEVGNYSVKAGAGVQGTRAQVSHPMTVVEPGRKLLLTTDKPLYQPGQTIHLRALALAAPGNTPVAASPAVFEVFDGKGNKVFRRELTTDAYGIAATKFVIGGVVNEGTFKIETTLGAARTERTVSVSRYALPKFGLDVDVDRAWYGPGDRVSGTVDARYFFGRVLEGADVLVEGYTLDLGESLFGRAAGKTDAAGRMAFNLTLPPSLVGLPLDQGNALANLRITVTDTAGQVVTRETALTVASAPARVTVVPESTSFVPGIPNRLRVFATDPLGAPVPGAAVSVQVQGQTLEAVTDAFGQAVVTFTPAAGQGYSTLDVTLVPEGGAPVSQQVSFDEQQGESHLLLRSERATYDVGDSVNVEVLAAGSASRAYVDWIHEGQAVDMRTVDLVDGKATFAMPVDPSLLGANRVEAYVVDAGGGVVRAGRTLFVRGATALDVSLATDKPLYAPGEPAKLTFSVKDESGAPAVAALGVQIVDEAVFGLVDSRPGLLRTFFEIEDEFATPRYEIQAPPASLPDLLFDRTRQADAAAKAAAEAQAEALFAALGRGSVTGIQEAAWPVVTREARQLLGPYLEGSKAGIAVALRSAFANAGEELAAAGCTPQMYYCDSLGQSFGEALFGRVGPRIALVDFWGNAYVAQPNGWSYSLTLQSPGPDELPGTDDDVVLQLSADDLGLSDALGGVFPGPIADGGAPPPPWAGGGGFGGGLNGGGTPGLAPAGRRPAGARPRRVAPRAAAETKGRA